MLSIEDVSSVRQLVQLLAMALVGVGMILSLWRREFGMIVAYLALGGLIVFVPLLVTGPEWISVAILAVIALLIGLNMYYKSKLTKRAQAAAPKNLG